MDFQDVNRLKLILQHQQAQIEALAGVIAGVEHSADQFGKDRDSARYEMHRWGITLPSRSATLVPLLEYTEYLARKEANIR